MQIAVGALVVLGVLELSAPLTALLSPEFDEWLAALLMAMAGSTRAKRETYRKLRKRDPALIDPTDPRRGDL